MASVSRVHVDDDGIFAATRGEIVLDVLFDGRRIWSFWLHPRRRGARRRAPSSPGPRRSRASSTARRGSRWSCTAPARCSTTTTLGSAPRPGGSRSSTATGKPLGLDKTQPARHRPSAPAAPSTSPRCSTRSRRSSPRCGKAGVEPFLAYGTLLGAVRDGRLIGHDSDADLGYVSRAHPPRST